MEATATASPAFAPRIPGRTCGTCALCCKIPTIPELNKPYNTWCTYCSDHTHCGIYETRPQRCRDFNCYFLGSTLGEEWRPSICHMVITTLPDRQLVMVDPAHPEVWRGEPYITTLRHWATQIMVYAMVGPLTYAVFPDHTDALGEVTDDHQILITEEMTLHGPRKKAVRVFKGTV